MKFVYKALLFVALFLLALHSSAYAKPRKASLEDARRALLPVTIVAPATAPNQSDVWRQAATLSVKRAAAQQGLLVIPAAPVVVAPNQPAVEPGNTKGIINALCDVPLYIIGCSFSANAAVITCDTNGDGTADLQIPLKDVGVVNRNLVHATIPALAPQLPGTAFPLACCGGTAEITVIQRVGAGDDNIFGEYTLKATCPIDLGLRAPVVVSASPSEGNCAIGQNIQVPGACFLMPDGKPNVAAVFAVEKGNPANLIQATRFVILTANLIDALFEIGATNAGKKFLIYASGPNGTSRNLSALPQGAPVGCPLGNEQGVEVTFTCASPRTPNDETTPPPPTASVTQCRLERTDTGVFILTISGRRFKQNALVTVGGVIPKKMKFKEADPLEPNTFQTIIAKGRFCDGLPGVILVANPGELSSQPFQCNMRCAD